ncbi:metal tolerance protein C4 [Tanacetum coccineum]
MINEITQVLLNAQSVDESVRKQAEESLKQFQEQNLAGFLYLSLEKSFCDEINHVQRFPAKAATRYKEDCECTVHASSMRHSSELKNIILNRASLAVAMHAVRKGAAAEGMTIRDYVWRGHDLTSVPVMTELVEVILLLLLRPRINHRGIRNGGGHDRGYTHHSFHGRGERSKMVRFLEQRMYPSLLSLLACQQREMGLSWVNRSLYTGGGLEIHKNGSDYESRLEDIFDIDIQANEK